MVMEDDDVLPCLELVCGNGACETMGWVVNILPAGLNGRGWV